MEPAAAAAVLAVVLYVFHSTLPSAASAVVELREGNYRVDRLRPFVTEEAKKVAEAFSDLQLRGGSLFVVDRPRKDGKPDGKYVQPPRQGGEGLEADEFVSISDGKCIVLDLGSVTADGGAAAGVPGAAAAPDADTQRRLLLLETEQARQRAHRFNIPPVPAPLASPSRAGDASSAASASSSQRAAYKALQAAAHQKQLDLKVAALQFYGLDMGPYTVPGNWVACNMLDVDVHDGSHQLIAFSDCTLAHIYPKSMDDHLLEEMGLFFHLPVGFLDEPRSFLILPKIVELAFDRAAVLLVPSIGGQIYVRPWHVDRMTTDEGIQLQRYLNQPLTWPNRQAASPHLPFMRMLAHRMLFQSHKAPEGLDDAAAELLEQEKQHAMGASASSAGNKAVGMWFTDFTS